MAQSDAETSAGLEDLFGGHQPYQEFLAALKAAVATGDRSAVAALVAYPLPTTIAGEKVTIRSEEDFVGRYEWLFTPAVGAAVARQTYATLLADWQGVMIGDGEIWFSGICGDDACSRVNVRITAVNVPDRSAPRGGHPLLSRTPAGLSSRRRHRRYPVPRQTPSAFSPPAEPAPTPSRPPQRTLASGGRTGARAGADLNETETV